MNARIKYSVLLVGVGVILAFLPFDASESFRLKSDELLAKSATGDMFLQVDQVARMINQEDSTIQLIDVRDAVQYHAGNLPGSINIPLSDLLKPSWEGTLNQKETKKIFYGNDDQVASTAWTIVTGLGYQNNFVIKGGLNEWYRVVMLSKFSGGNITPAENALFENRLNARRTFTQLNSLPDSLKGRYFKTKRIKLQKLDGGCQ